MHSLSDFWLRSFNIFPWIKDFEKILWSVYELEVLILKTNSWQQWRSISVTNSVLHWFSGSKLSSNHQESNRIADTCNTVRPLPPRPRKVFGRSQTTSECSIRLPSDLYVERFHATSYLVLTLSIAAPQCIQVLAKIVDNDQQGGFNRVSSLYIYLFDSRDMPSITMLTMNMAVTFPQIKRITVCFEHQCGIVSSLLIKIMQ